MLTPLRFEPIYKDKIWGGHQLHALLNKQGASAQCGESWEVSAVSGDVSRVAEGPHKGRTLTELQQEFGDALVGKSVRKRYGSTFPLLVKFIDAAELLSVQVHPDDALAMKKHNSLGKTEMWYIVDAEPGAWLYAGWNKPVSREEYLEAFEQGRLLDLLLKVEVKAGDIFFIPAGLIHSIGAGIVLAEIQENSDITYRVYDFDRRDDAGKLRDLHVADALDALTFGMACQSLIRQEPVLNTFVQVVDCPHFTTHVLHATHVMERNLPEIDSLKIVMGLEGSAQIRVGETAHTLAKGDTLLIPAGLTQWKIEPNPSVRLLETYIRG
jgi:mannose-6-phosphate isomerase